MHHRIFFPLNLNLFFMHYIKYVKMYNVHKKGHKETFSCPPLAPSVYYQNYSTKSFFFLLSLSSNLNMSMFSNNVKYLTGWWDEW